MTKFSKTLLALCGLAISFAACSQDHPLLSGMPGYAIDDRKVSEFDRYPHNFSVFNCKPDVKCTPEIPGIDAEGHLVAEGKVTYLRYSKSGDYASPTAILRNYENAIQALGGKKISYYHSPRADSLFYIEKAGAKIWVVLDTQVLESYKLYIIEGKALEQTVTAGQLEQSLKSQGYATLYINFDTNKTTVKPDAKPTLDEIVALLKKDTALRLSIEGHTDNVGSAASNKALSQGRAEEVVKALVNSGIDAKRLGAKGFGSENPVADNRNEEGRTKNRRVELVKM
jgi:OmpA-OmpF porin, OOP family